MSDVPRSNPVAVPSGRPHDNLVRGSRADKFESAVLHVVFVASGVAALLYQLVWQRSLLMLYGSNTESVAMVVSAFLVGLGCGSILGGWISKSPRAPLVLLFSATELLIGVYGLLSLALFHRVAEHTATAGTIETGLLAFALVLVPTLLMGATLPLLVAYRVRASGHVGQSISWLYFVNTFGAALGAFAASVGLLAAFGLSGTVRLAASCNVVSALAVLCLGIRGKRAP